MGEVRKGKVWKKVGEAVYVEVCQGDMVCYMTRW